MDRLFAEETNILEQVIMRISFCLKVIFFSFKENILGQCESSGSEPVNIAAEERASLGNTSCGNSSLEPEDPGKKRVYMFLEMTETATLSLTFTERGDQSS